MPETQKSEDFPEFRPEAGEVLIYPSWAKFSHKWNALPELFLSPVKWNLQFLDLSQLKELGYTVRGRDHRFFDGPNGGGLIQVFRDSHRWFPVVLFLEESAYRNPRGFPTIGKFSIRVIVPQATNRQRFLCEPIPRAPSPHVSVEQLRRGVTEQCVALGASMRFPIDDIEFLAGYPTLALKIERLAKIPEYASDAFAKVDDPRLSWQWYSVKHPRLTPCLWVAAIVYLGLRLADLPRHGIRDMHIFTSEYIPNQPFPSAQLWTSRKTKGIVMNANDW